MPGPPKGTPRSPNAGRRKGTPNKRTAYRRQVAEAIAEGRKTGAGILVAVEKLEEIAGRFIAQALVAEKANKPATYNDMLEKAARVLKDLAPYQTPKLASVIMKGDAKAPLNLSGLSDSELAFLRRTMLKAGSGSEGE